MLVKHETQNIIRKIGAEELRQAFEEGVNLFRDGRAVYELLNAVQNNEVSSMDAAEEAEDYLAGTYPHIELFHTYQSSTNATINKYLGRVLPELRGFFRNLTIAVDCLFNISREELERLRIQAYRVTAGMVFFCTYEFDLLGIVASSEDGKLEVDEVVQGYCELSGSDSLEIANELISGLQEYHVKFDLFDSYPEYEEVFLRLMGPSIAAVDEQQLTLEMVRDVAVGEITPEELIAQMVPEESADLSMA